MPCVSSSCDRVLVRWGALGAILAAAAMLAWTPALAQNRASKPAAAPPPPAPAQAAPVNPMFGLWIDHTGDGAVEIAPCAPGSKEICGRIVWLRSPTDGRGRPLADELNEDNRFRGRPICGMPVLGDLKPQPSGNYDEGWVYDPRQGKAFDVQLTLKGPDRLEVMGYKRLKMLNRKYDWTRASIALPRCEQSRV